MEKYKINFFQTVVLVPSRFKLILYSIKSELGRQILEETQRFVIDKQLILIHGKESIENQVICVIFINLRLKLLCRASHPLLYQQVKDYMKY